MRFTEKPGNLFSTCTKFSLCHAVSADLKMGAGIALQFRLKFGNLNLLRQQDRTVGEVIWFRLQSRHIICMITKRFDLCIIYPFFLNFPSGGFLRSQQWQISRNACLNWNVTALLMALKDWLSQKLVCFKENYSDFQLSYLQAVAGTSFIILL